MFEMEPSLDFVVVFLAVLKAGASAIPVSPSLPAAGLASSVTRARPMLAIGEHITGVVDCVSNLVVCHSLNRYQTTLLMNDRGGARQFVASARRGFRCGNPAGVAVRRQNDRNVIAGIRNRHQKTKCKFSEKRPLLESLIEPVGTSCKDEFIAVIRIAIRQIHDLGKPAAFIRRCRKQFPSGGQIHQPQGYANCMSSVGSVQRM